MRLLVSMLWRWLLSVESRNHKVEVLSIWVKSFDPSDSLWVETKAVSFVVENMMATGFSDFLLEDIRESFLML